MYKILLNKKDYENNKLQLTVFITHYNIENQTHADLPTQAPFFLDFLLNNEFKYNYLKQLTENYQPYTNNFLSTYAHDFISEVEQTEIRNYPFNKWLKKYHLKRSISDKDNSKILQADYTIKLKDGLFMNHIFEGFIYTGNYQNLDNIIVDNQYTNLLPNTYHLQQDIELLEESEYTPIQIKISNNNDYIFTTSVQENMDDEIYEIEVIDTTNWDYLWTNKISDAYANIIEDKKEKILYLKDFDEVLEAFYINNGQAAKHKEKAVYQFMSPSLELYTELEENAPLKIKNLLHEIVLTIPQFEENIYTLAFSNDDNFIAIAYKNCIHVWDIKKQLLAHSISFEKGVWQKIIFGHNSSIIYGLSNNIVYGFNIAKQDMLFMDEGKKNMSIVDFDISEKYYAIIYQNTQYNINNYIHIHTIGISNSIIDAALFRKLKIEAEAEREAINRYASVLKNLPYVKETSYYIDNLKVNLTNKYNWINLGHKFERIKNYEAGILCTKVAMEIAPNDNTVLYNIGTFYMNLQDYDTAILYLKKCIKIDPNYYSAYINLSSTLSRIGAYEEAEQTILELLEKKPNMSSIYTTLSMIYLRSKQLEKAREISIKGLRNGNTAQCCMNLAHTYYLANDIEKAKYHYNSSLKNFFHKSDFFEDMIDDYSLMSTYNISEETWLNFVEEFR